jgi:hypothetical protein
MASRLFLYTLVASAAVGGFALVADALVVSDEERLEAVADELTEGPADERVDGVLRRIDLSREPLRLEHGERVRRYSEDDDHRLADGVWDALGPFADEDLEVVQRAVRLDGDRGTVAVRVRAGSELHDATLHLVRSGQGWLVTRLRTR